jgi:transposase-like protein
MAAQSIEQELRCEAVRRRLQGQRVCDICQDLHRSPRWLNKWWHEYHRHPDTDFADRSHAPRTSPQQVASETEQAIVALRRTLEAGATPDTRYGLIGARAIVGHLQRLNVQPLPSRATVQRILAKHGLTHPLGSNHAAAYYPWPVPWAINAIQATDIITKHLRGGEVIQNFHTLDLSSHAVWLTQHWDKTTVTATTHLLTAWAHLGRPLVHQFDNESTFGGGPTHARVLGHVVRLCLYCQIEPFFTPTYDAKRNHQIETFHSLWVAAFWSRQEFASLAEVQTEVQLFLRWYRTEYQPPALHGKTPAQARQGFRPPALTQPLRSLIPVARLPLTAGRIHVMRKVDLQGMVTLFNEPWLVGKRWMGEYIRATIDTALQQVSFWHKPEATAAWRHLKTRQFRLQETVHEVVPEFCRNSARCREYFPS